MLLLHTGTLTIATTKPLLLAVFAMPSARPEQRAPSTQQAEQDREENSAKPINHVATPCGREAAEASRRRDAGSYERGECVCDGDVTERDHQKNEKTSAKHSTQRTHWLAERVL